MMVPDLLRGAVFVSQDPAPHAQLGVRPCSRGPRQGHEPTCPEEASLGQLEGIRP